MICEACHGNGYEKSGKRCGACHGSGEKITRDGRRRSECLMRAHNIITQTDHVHGEAMETLANTAIIWSVIFKIPVRPDQVASAMEGLKMARRIADPTNPDNWDDAAGYVGLGAEAVAYEN